MKTLLPLPLLKTGLWSQLPKKLSSEKAQKKRQVKQNRVIRVGPYIIGEVMSSAFFMINDRPVNE